MSNNSFGANGDSANGIEEQAQKHKFKRRPWLHWLQTFIEEPIILDDTASRKSRLALISAPLTLCLLSILGLVCTAAGVALHHGNPFVSIAYTAAWSLTAVSVAVVQPLTGSFILALVYICLLVAHAFMCIMLWPENSFAIMAMHLASSVLALSAFIFCS